MASYAELKKQKIEEEKKAEEETKTEPMDLATFKKELEDELINLKFKIKLTKYLKKIGTKNTYEMRKKYENIYWRKLKVYCEVCGHKYDDDITDNEMKIRYQELRSEVNKISEGGYALGNLLNKIF